MAWTYGEIHADRWRVSSLIWAFVELILACIVLLCAAISVTTTKLIRSSGLCLSCRSCEVDSGKETRASRKHLELCQNPQDCHRQLPGTSSASQPLSDAECNRHPPYCVCCYADQTNNPSSPTPRATTSYVYTPPRVFLNCASSSSLGYHSCSSGLWQEDDSNYQRVDSFSPNADQRSVRDTSIGARKPSAASDCECRLCKVAMNSELSSLPGRPLKRKFAKVFPGDNRDGSSRDQTQGYVDSGESSGAQTRGYVESVSEIAKKTPVGGIHNYHHVDRGEAGASLNLLQEEITVDDECEDVEQMSSLRKQFGVSDSEDVENMRKVSWENFSGNSSQDSITYNRRLPVDFGRGIEASGNRKGEGMCNDSQFGRGSRGEISPVWSGSYEVSHSFDEMEEGSSVANQDDDDDRLEYCGMKELREALRAERKALVELYNELEQERSASATAANEAMAMITRLQEEKAAAQMEYRQFQRMAEEKQVYDQEGIALLQDILVRRDEEVFKLEEEAKLYRQRLLALTMDELDRAGTDSSGGLKKKSDFLLIERETLLLEGNDEWQNRRDSREERLLAEIREWVTAANEKVAAKASTNVPAIEKEESTEKAKLPSKISNMSIDSGRKNLLQSFSSVVGDEENQRDDGAIEAGAGSEIGSEDFAVRNDDTTTTVGYESFHTMMDSLRKEPRLRDEASLETLNKIEEKFQKQSRKGKVRNEDDLRQIWKNTLRSLSPTAVEHIANRAVKKQDPKGQTEEIIDNSGLMSGIVRDAEANRAMEQKRISVLEYVWKFEEQLHQGGTKKPAPQLGRTISNDSHKVEKPASSTSETGVDDQSATKGSLAEFSAAVSERDKCKKRPDGNNLPPSRFRRHASEADRFHMKGDAPSPRSTLDSQEGKYERPYKHEDDESIEGSPVCDVYEVQRDLLETSAPKRSGMLYNDEVKKLPFATNSKVMRGESACSAKSDVYVEFLGDHGDRLRKPDPLPGYHSLDHKAHGKGRPPPQTGVGRYVTSSPEDESLDQDFEWPATSTSEATAGRTPQTPSSIAKLGDVVDQLAARLKSLETDRQTMQETISSLRAENGEIQLLQGIAQQLRELRGMDQKANNSTEQEEPTFSSSIKGILSFSLLRCSMQAQLNKLARVFLRNVDLGVCRGDQHVGLCRLLQIFPQRPIRVTRVAEASAEEIVLSGPQEGSLQQSPPLPSTLLSQHTWPVDVRERSGTALSGWDY